MRCAACNARQGILHFLVVRTGTLLGLVRRETGWFYPTDGERAHRAASRQQYGVVREELPFPVPGIYGCPIGQCRDATTGWIMAERL